MAAQFDSADHGSHDDFDVRSVGFRVADPPNDQVLNSRRGQWEGRTSPDVIHVDPYLDDDAREWFEDTGRWWDEKSYPDK